MKCKSCGTEIPENTRFCPNCGLLVSAQISFEGIRKALKPVEYRMPEKKKREDASPAFAPGGKEEEAEKTVSSASAEERAEEDQKFSEEMDQLHFDFSLDRSRLGPVREGEESEWEPPELFTRLSEDEEPEESAFSYEEPRAEDSLEGTENPPDTAFSDEEREPEGSEENASDTDRYAASPDNVGEALSSRGETEREEAEAEREEAETEQAEAEAERERIRRAEAERSEEEARLQRMEAEREKIRRAEAERRAEEAERHRLAEEARREEEERIRRAEAERKALEEERARASGNAKSEEQERITAELKAFLGTEEESDAEPETKNPEVVSASSSEGEAERESSASPEAELQSLMETEMETDSHPLAEETSASREDEKSDERERREEQGPDAEIRESSWWEEEEKRENVSAEVSSSLPPLSEEEKARMASEMLGTGGKSEDAPSLSEEREDPTSKEHSSKSGERDPFIWGESRADRSEKEKRSGRGKKKERERRSGGGRKAGSGKEGKKKGGALKLFLPAAATAAAIAAALWYMNLPAVKRSGELNMGREAVKKQHYEQAIPILEKLLSEKEGGREAYLLLVDAYEKAGKHEEAVKTLTAAVESFPEDSELKQQLELLNPKLSFSASGGSYQDPQEIRISGPEGAEIRYSLSGGSLEEVKDAVYENPIHLDTNGSYHLSAFAKASDGAEGETLSADYEITLDSAKYHLNDWSDTEAGRIFLDENGRRRTGWFQKDGNWYYFNADGILQTGLQEIDGDQYFLKEDGACLISAWQEIDGELYYFGPDGRMQKNQWVDGNYYVGEDGKRQKNTTIDGKHLNEEGQAAFHAAEEYKAHPDMIVVAHSKQRVDKGNYYIIPSTVYYEKKNGRPVGKPAYQIDVKILKEAYVHYLDEDYMTIIAQDSVSFLPELYMQKIIQNDKGYIKDYSFVLGEDKG